MKKGGRGKNITKTTVVIDTQAGGGKGKGKGKKGKKGKRLQRIAESMAEQMGNVKYRLQVSNPAKGDAATIWQMISNSISEPCQVIDTRTTNNSIFFTLGGKDERAARAIKRLDKRLNVNGHQATIKLEKIVVKASASAVEIPLPVLSQRYNPSDKCLMLPALMQDPGMADLRSMPNGMGNINVANGIINAIQKNCADLVTLDMTNNDITSLAAWRRLGSVAKNLTNLSLADNGIKNLSELQFLRTCRQVTHLVLKGNPVLNTMSNRSAYEKQVLKYFKGLKLLDQEPITTTLAQAKQGGQGELVDQVLLPAERCNVPTPEIRQNLIAFLAQFFTQYDGGPAARASLQHLYADNAALTLLVPSIGHGGTGLARYNTTSKKKMKSINVTKRGPRDIVKLIEHLPNTVHQNAAELSMNVLKMDASEVSFEVSGHFQEPRPKSKPLYRAFRRTMTIRPSLPGSPQGAGAAGTAGAGMAASMAAAAPAGGVPDQATQQMMVMQLSQMSGMNQQFSTDCLANNGWNYDAAVANFQQLQAGGQIPPQAFTS
ncbi:uncharacterized protein MONBRDRAFT_32915 [Monosiga brevicollis MX1]|uniref:TAP-C domain-containing protein n=1 Tax=Monosiga brevicollis TaxID=81824 RepID=A9V2I0_MONBE|nr:uncharacterized protein MONBRDRAFT_32915 [Monosiga brevicollis MX1]EDQ88381.1 predicted protein [Monosiga brevicollis MX1]|eukprot:XP_001746974.1 hypothetical protein [Monosiga brevicollis MX1]